MGIDPGAGGCFIDRNLNGVSDTLWTRFYFYMENFQVDTISGTKWYNTGDPAFYPSFQWGWGFGSLVADVNVQGIILPSEVLDTKAYYTDAAVPQNQWVCVESHVTLNTPGQSNGVIQAWYNGSQVMNTTGVKMREAVLNQNNNPNMKFKFLRLYTQHGRGVLYFDNYAVSRDARIGCAGSPSGNMQSSSRASKS